MSDQLAMVEVQQSDKVVSILISGEIDMSNAASVKEDIEKALTDAAYVDIDLTPIEFIDSQGIRVLHQIALGLQGSETRLRLIAPRDSIAGQVLDLTRTQDIVTVVESAEG